MRPNTIYAHSVRVCGNEDPGRGFAADQIFVSPRSGLQLSPDPEPRPDSKGPGRMHSSMPDS